jgi:hypothetical protein
MNKPKKNRQSLHLQMSNNRWKWMAGATAATAAGVSASQATTITIDLAGNYISATGGNHLDPDLTGDGHPDLTINAAHLSSGGSGFSTKLYSARVDLNGVTASASAAVFHTSLLINATERLGSLRGTSSRLPLTGSIPIFFQDLNINGGAPTTGTLQVTVSVEGLERAKVQLDSFTYTSNTTVQASSPTVPEQGSSLALLAMGTGGVLALRRWRAMQGHS